MHPNQKPKPVTAKTMTVTVRSMGTNNPVKPFAVKDRKRVWQDAGFSVMHKNQSPKSAMAKTTIVTAKQMMASNPKNVTEPAVQVPPFAKMANSLDVLAPNPNPKCATEKTTTVMAKSTTASQEIAKANVAPDANYAATEPGSHVTHHHPNPKSVTAKTTTVTVCQTTMPNAHKVASAKKANANSNAATANAPVDRSVTMTDTAKAISARGSNAPVASNVLPENALQHAIS
jgi:hypothetical protein